MATYDQETNPFMGCKTSNKSVQEIQRKNAPGSAVDINETNVVQKTNIVNNTSGNIKHSEEIDLMKDVEEKIQSSKESSNLEILASLNFNSEDSDQSEFGNNCLTITKKLLNDKRFEELKIDDKILDSNKASSYNMKNYTFKTETILPQSPSQSPTYKNDLARRKLTPPIEIEEEEDQQEEDNNKWMSQDINDKGKHIVEIDDHEEDNQHLELIKKLRLQLNDLEKYAYEKGELEKAPPLLLAERQTVILNALKSKLSLEINIDELERTDIVELKRQVDKEIQDFIDPLITKENVLQQLKTQLGQLEDYVKNLHSLLGNNDGIGFNKTLGTTSNCNCSKEANELIENNSTLLVDTLPRTSELIKNLVSQLVCSELKIKTRLRDQDISSSCNVDNNNGSKQGDEENLETIPLDPLSDCCKSSDNNNYVPEKSEAMNSSAWLKHIDKVILAKDSLHNLFTSDLDKDSSSSAPLLANAKLVDSVVRKQLIPAIKALLSYGLIDSSASTTSVLSFFDPYYLLSSLTCLPSSANRMPTIEKLGAKLHVWDVIVDYYKRRDDYGSRSSSARTLTQSFNLTNTSDAPIRITSKQALLISLETIRDKVAKSKPNGPEAHFRAFIYTALNQGKLSIWLRLIFKRSVLRHYYATSFIHQSDKMDSFFKILDGLSQFEFKLETDLESTEQFESAF